MRTRRVDVSDKPSTQASPTDEWGPVLPLGQPWGLGPMLISTRGPATYSLLLFLPPLGLLQRRRGRETGHVRIQPRSLITCRSAVCSSGELGPYRFIVPLFLLRLLSPLITTSIQYHSLSLRPYSCCLSRQLVGKPVAYRPLLLLPSLRFLQHQTDGATGQSTGLVQANCDSEQCSRL